eukprot:431627-Hanusia_phi.AAC.1
MVDGTLVSWFPDRSRTSRYVSSSTPASMLLIPLPDKLNCLQSFVQLPSLVSTPVVRTRTSHPPQATE